MPRIATLNSFSSMLTITTFLILINFLISEARTMDQIIKAAARTPAVFDLLSDPEGAWILHDLDMLLTPEQYEALFSHENPHRYKRKARRGHTYRWTNSDIPYVVDSSAEFSSEDLQELYKSFEEWQRYTCLNFRQKAYWDKNFILFTDGRGCSSPVGMQGGEQRLNLAPECRRMGVISHEIGHALGFYHEQSRPDRDDHISVVLENIPQPFQFNFQKFPESEIDTHGVPYDYKSIMHYGSKAFSINNKPTIITKLEQYQNVIGNRKALSFHDIKLANLMYNCGSQCKTYKKCPEEGFLDKNCKCWCPGDPIKPCGTSGGRVTSRPSTSPKPVTSDPGTKCIDEHELCYLWAGSPERYCVTNDFVKTFCKLSCDLCDGAKPEEEEKCENYDGNCYWWREQGFCKGLYESFMKTKCPLSCGYCTRISGFPKRGTTSPATKPTDGSRTSTKSEESESAGGNSNLRTESPIKTEDGGNNSSNSVETSWVMFLVSFSSTIWITLMNRAGTCCT